MIECIKLDNGIRLVLEPMMQVESATVGFWFRTGAVDENAGNAGISHFTEHMMFKGTPTREASDIAKDMDAIGAQMNAFTGKETTCYYVKATSENLLKAVDIMVDMLENSLFLKEEMDRERLVIGEEIKMTDDAPDELAHATLVKKLFRGSHLSNSILGTVSSLKKISTIKMKNYVADNYVKHEMVISIAGGFDSASVYAFFQDKFKGMKDSKSDVRRNKAEDAPSFSMKKRDIKQAHICMGRRAISMDDPSRYAMKLLNNIIGGSMSSRLFQNIRETKGLAYSVCSGLVAFSDDGYFEIYAAVAQDKVGNAIRAIQEEIIKLEDTHVSIEELDASREQLKASCAFERESSSARMSINGKNYLLLGHTVDQDEIMNGYDAVTMSDLENVKEKICGLDKYSISLVSGKKHELRPYVIR